jgi:hypothetical protein
MFFPFSCSRKKHLADFLDQLSLLDLLRCFKRRKVLNLVTMRFETPQSAASGQYPK